jgi:hypothetical protein
MIIIQLLLSLSRGLTVLMPQPVSLHSESTEYDYPGLSSGPPVSAALHFALDPEQNTLITSQSSIIFAPTLDFRSRSPMEPDFGAAPSDSPEAGAETEPPKEQKTSELAEYSPIFKLGLFLSVPLCFSSMLLLLV